MADAAYVKSRKWPEMENRIRRFIGDISPKDMIVSVTRLREVMFTSYIELLHDLGYDPRTERNAAGTQEYSFAVAAGDYQTAEVHSKEPIALGEAYNNRSSEPMNQVDRWLIEQWILQDQRDGGSIVRGIPTDWALATYYDSTNNRTVYRFMFYPAADAATTVVFPHTVVDIANLDSTSQSIMLSFIAEQALMRRVAVEVISALSAEDLQRLRLSPEWVALNRERAELDVARAREQRLIAVPRGTIATADD